MLKHLEMLKVISWNRNSEWKLSGKVLSSSTRLLFSLPMLGLGISTQMQLRFWVKSYKIIQACLVSLPSHLEH